MLQDFIEKTPLGDINFLIKYYYYLLNIGQQLNIFLQFTFVTGLAHLLLQHTFLNLSL